VEVFGDGNIILVKDEKIIQPLFPHTWSARALRAGKEYKFPPTRNNPKTIELDDFLKIFNESDKDLVRTLIMNMDIPGKFAEELCSRAGLEKKEKAAQVQNEDRIKIFELMQDLFNKVETEPKAILVYENEKTPEPLELMPIKLETFNEYYHRELTGYNEAVREFFHPGSGSVYTSEKLEEKALAERETAIARTSSEESRLSRQLEQQRSALEKFSSEIKINHEFGEAIYGNYQRCEELLNKIKELRSEVAPDEIIEQLSKTDDIKELNPHKGFVILKLKTLDGSSELDVKLNLRKNIIENANIYYDSSKRAKEKLRGTEKALRKTKAALSKLDKKLKSIEKIEIPKAKPALGKHFWFEKYHWLLTSEGNIVVAGRDAKSNDQVVKKYLKDKDRYCHADLSGAPSVVVKHDPESAEISEETLQQACEFGLLFSKAWNAKVGAGTAYWVKPSQVSKTPQSGEFLARGAFVIRGKRNYIGKIKLELGLGEITYQGKRKLMAGPVSPVRAHAKRYVVLVPGDVKKNIMAKELSELFNVVVDEVLSVLPSGEFELVEKIGFKQ
jgi:predicted ribosome quality control (RQC) complex YloA/Tae2 family protein